MFILIFTLIILSVTNPTRARVIPFSALERRGIVLSAAQVSELTPFTQFARAAYCPSEKIKDWKCGEACDALPGFEVTLMGGDGGRIQHYFIGYWPQEKAIVVVHEGTNPRKIRSVIVDLLATKGPLDPAIFPKVPDGVFVHTGFRKQHKKSAAVIFNEVRRLLDEKSSKQVITIGHSLGGALAMLSALSMKLQLPKDVSVRSTTYGTPRVGNRAFATFFDSQISNFKRVNNNSDPVPIVPGRFLGFVHPQGEIHILPNGEAVTCPGNDNADDDQCQIKTVPNIFTGKSADHPGSYNGIWIGHKYCQ